MSSDLTAAISAALDRREVHTRRMLRYAQENHLAVQEPQMLGRRIPGWHEWPEVERMMAAALVDIAAKRKVLGRHQPEPTAYGQHCMCCPDWHRSLDAGEMHDHDCAEILDLAEAEGVSTKEAT